MTKEAILTELLRYLASMEESDQKLIKKNMEHDLIFSFDAGCITLSNLLVNVQRDVRAETAKAAGKAKPYQAALQIIKSAQRDALKGATIYDGVQYVCDGRRALKFNDPMDIPAIPDSVRPIDCRPVFAAAAAASNPLSMPDAAELKAHIKIKRAELAAAGNKKSAVMWDFGEGAPLVDAGCLLSIIEAFPDCTARYSNLLSPLYFEAGAGAALLCPIRKKTA